MKRVLLGMGSNRVFEDKTPLEILDCACTELEKIMQPLSFSSVYRSKAMYVENQEDFYNMVALGYVSDDLDPFEFLKKINEIEAFFGRDRKKEIRFGPRTLDLDIELFGEENIKTPLLEIPHPRMKERAFVLIPTIEILTNSADINLKKEYEKCLEKLRKQGTLGVEKICSYGNGNSEKWGRNKNNCKACL